MVLQQETVPYREGYTLGIGVAMATGSPLGLGVEGTESPPKVGPGGSGVFIFSRAESTQDLKQSLEVEAEVDAGIGLFGASAAFKFANECRIQKSSLVITMKAEEWMAFQQIDNPRLSEEAERLARKNQIEASRV